MLAIIMIGIILWGRITWASPLGVREQGGVVRNSYRNSKEDRAGNKVPTSCSGFPLQNIDFCITQIPEVLKPVRMSPQEQGFFGTARFLGLGNIVT